MIYNWQNWRVLLDFIHKVYPRGKKKLSEKMKKLCVNRMLVFATIIACFLGIKKTDDHCGIKNIYQIILLKHTRCTPCGKEKNHI